MSAASAPSTGVPPLRGSLYDALIRLAENRPLNDRGRQPVVHRIGHYQPEPGVYEVFARISAGPRLHALAFRLHRGDDHRWLCAAVEMAGRPTRGTGRERRRRQRAHRASSQRASTLSGAVTGSEGWSTRS